MPVPNLPPRDAITGRFLEATVKDTAKNLNTPAKITTKVPVPPVAPRNVPKAAVNPTPLPVNRNAPARPVAPKVPVKKGR